MTNLDPRERRRRVAILWRAERGDPAGRSNRLFESLASGLAKVGVSAVPVLYADHALDEVRRELLGVGGVLVWVDPISNGRSRVALDALLREVAAHGVFVSAHPDVILKMGTKEVLHRTRELGWGTETFLYDSARSLRDAFPRVLAASGPRVLKQNRSNGGLGVFRVELVQPGALPDADAPVHVQHAQRGSARERMSLGEWLDRCEGYLANGGKLVDQPFAARHAEGMVRCYLVQNRAAGFGHQRVTALMDPEPGEAAPPLPPPRLYCGPTQPEYQVLARMLEREWVPGMQKLLDIDSASLPLLWDADFLLGPKSAAGDDTYVLCEINASSVYPFPDEALEPLVRAAAARLGSIR